MSKEVKTTTPEVVEDKGSFGWAVLGFFFPLVGLILFIVWESTKKKSAKQAGIGALVGFCLRIVLPIILIPLFLLIFIPFIVSELPENVSDITCRSTFGNNYIAVEENDEWYCENTITNERVKLTDIEEDDLNFKINISPSGKKYLQSYNVEDGYDYEIVLNGDKTYTFYEYNQNSGRIIITGTYVENSEAYEFKILKSYSSDKCELSKEDSTYRIFKYEGGKLEGIEGGQEFKVVERTDMKHLEDMYSIKNITCE